MLLLQENIFYVWLLPAASQIILPLAILFVCLIGRVLSYLSAKIFMLKIIAEDM